MPESKIRGSLIKAAQIDGVHAGTLQINVISSLGSRPIQNAVIRITFTENPQQIIESLQTDSSGQTETVTLPAPPPEYSLEPINGKPYSEYNIEVSAPGYQKVLIMGTQVLPGIKSIQPITLVSEEEAVAKEKVIMIAPHKLYGDYPQKIPEAEIKPVDETGKIVLSRVIIPEYVVVHDGSPADSLAPDYYVKYRDYIKNVASSEIYATWPESTVYANILAIMSFTLNRVYTEW